jgi:hypothetical protein
MQGYERICSESGTSGEKCLKLEMAVGVLADAFIEVEVTALLETEQVGTGRRLGSSPGQ